MKQSAAEQIAVLREKIKESQKQIESIQNQCSHVWKKVKLPDLKETLVAGVYVGNYEGSIAVPEPANTDFKCVCEKCEKVISGRITHTCPHCLVDLKDVEYNGFLRVGRRKEYFGKDYLYFGVSIQRCPKCEFRVASDIWDQ